MTYFVIDTGKVKWQDLNQEGFVVVRISAQSETTRKFTPGMHWINMGKIDLN